jgi:addiction module HigA family antidote
MTKRRLPPIHPGEVLREEFIRPKGLSAGKVAKGKVAKAIGTPRTRIERIVCETVGMTADTALRLARLFGTTPNYWMNLQAQYDLEQAATALGATVRKIQPISRGA